MSQNISLLKALLKVEASPSAPRLSSAQLLDAPENKAIQDIWALPPDNPRLHAGSKIAVLATDGVEEIEINTVLHYFRSRGAQVDLVAPRLPRYPTALGIQFPAIRETHIMTITYVATGGWIKFDRLLEDAAGDDYDAVVVQGEPGIPIRCVVMQKRSASSKKPRRPARLLPPSATAHGSFPTPA